MTGVGQLIGPDGAPLQFRPGMTDGALRQAAETSLGDAPAPAPRRGETSQGAVARAPVASTSRAWSPLPVAAGLVSTMASPADVEAKVQWRATMADLQLYHVARRYRAEHEARDAQERVRLGERDRMAKAAAEAEGAATANAERVSVAKRAADEATSAAAALAAAQERSRFRQATGEEGPPRRAESRARGGGGRGGGPGGAACE